MQRVSASIPVELGVALEERARAEDRSASAVVRRALAEHLQAFLSGSRGARDESAVSTMAAGSTVHEEET
jgi:predicted transcriptional regulator